MLPLPTTILYPCNYYETSWVMGYSCVVRRPLQRTQARLAMVRARVPITVLAYKIVNHAVPEFSGVFLVAC